jgi:hypothetical protein
VEFVIVPEAQAEVRAFKVVRPNLIVVRAAHRSTIYED